MDGSSVRHKLEPYPLKEGTSGACTKTLLENNCMFAVVYNAVGRCGFNMRCLVFVVDYVY